MPIFENCKKPNTSKVTAKEPANDTRNTEKPEALGQKAKLRAIANEAPALIPSKPESANGFLVTPCINAPLNAKQLPTRNAPATRGKRMFLMI